MEINLLQTFLAVADTGSFSAAGERLNSVQSNITARVRKLEQDLGGSLFERGRGGAKLTPLGERLQPHARDILTRVSHARAELRDAAGEAALLRLGVYETMAGSRLPSVLRQLMALAPKVEVNLFTGTTGELTRRVWARELDAAMVVGPVDKNRFSAQQVSEERLMIVRHASGEGGHTFLAFDTGCSYRSAAEDWLKAEGKADTPIRCFGDLDTILGCVGAGLGFAVAPESALNTRRSLDDIELQPMAGSCGHLHTSLIWRHDTPSTQVFQALLAALSCSA